MLELSMIQSTSRSKDAAAHSPEKASSKSAREDPRQEFQNEYDSTEKAEGPAEKPAESPENASETASDEGLTTKEQTQPDGAVAADPEATDVLESDPDAFPGESFGLAVVGDTKNRDARKAEAASTGTNGVQGKQSDPELVSLGKNGGKKPVAVDGPSEAAVVTTKTPPSGSKTTAETVVMTKAAENATNFSQPKVKDSSGHTDRAHAAAPAVGASTAQSQNTVFSTAQKPKVEGSTAQEVGRKKSETDLPRGIEFRRAPSAQVPVQATAVADMKPVLNQPMTLTKLSAAKEKPDMVSPIMSELDSIGVLNGRSAEHVSPTALNQVLNRAETPTMIARQMAEALQKLPDRPVEISLNPKELGRVRMNISAAEAGITVSVVAERPETLDLMRRNIEQLTREFQALGYDTINFSFAGGEAENSPGENTAEQPKGGAVTQLEILPEEQDTNTPQPTMVATSGVDIRI